MAEAKGKNSNYDGIEGMGPRDKGMTYTMTKREMLEMSVFSGYNKTSPEVNSGCPEITADTHGGSQQTDSDS